MKFALHNKMQLRCDISVSVCVVCVRVRVGVLQLFTCRAVGHYDKAKSALLVETKNGSAKNAICRAALQFFSLISTKSRERLKCKTLQLVSRGFFLGFFCINCTISLIQPGYFVSFELKE